ncbi:MAG: prephenate dehydrogenase/arogenate dehydrogenase family protein [Deltaproteobacteria bacterium]|nr:prephenate dehydrogenase/arogenate dehydrogenase family protein [Deltaproteobacteria bacterium]
MAVMFRKMVVAGVGLIGGSLALDMRRRKLVKQVVGYGRTEENLKVAKKARLIDSYFLREAEIPTDTDFLMLGTPVQTIVPLTEAFLPRLQPGCIVSDVGSVKAEIVRGMEKILPPDIHFVGAHPIAGSEQWGAQAARADLYVNKRCILTPTRRTDPAALKKMELLWRRVGAKVQTMDAVQHDKVLGIVSHLPHVVAYALVNALDQTKIDGIDLKTYCAGGFKDITRIAGSRPELWRDICLSNRKAVSQSLGNYIRNLEKLKRAIDGGRGAVLEKVFARAQTVRESIG